jgi:hypothetical protein
MTKRTKWHAFDEERAKALTDAQRPDVVFPSPCYPAPSGPLSMPGVVSWMGSNVSVPIVSSNGLTVGTEMVVVRTDGTLTKPYAYMVGTSTDGSLHYAGPYKDFQAHHVHPGQHISPADFFGNTPASKSETP